MGADVEVACVDLALGRVSLALGETEVARATLRRALAELLLRHARPAQRNAIPPWRSLRKLYNTHGHLSEVRAVGEAPRVIWKALSYNAAGDITSEVFNGVAITSDRTYHLNTGLLNTIVTRIAGTVHQSVSYDYYDNGRLRSRTDHNQNRSEVFVYDGAGRLKSSAITGQTLRTWSYDPLSNVTSTNEPSFAGFTWKYGEGAPGHHALTSLVSGAQTLSFVYDSYRNLTSTPFGRTVTFTPAGLPSLVMQNGIGYRFGYDADGVRSSKQSLQAVWDRTEYLGDDFELRTTRDTSGRVKSDSIHYIHAGGRLVAQLTIQYDQLTGQAPPDWRFIHADRLGVLMKLGAFGVLRVGMVMLPDGAHLWAPAVGTVAAVNIVYGALAAMAQKDLKYVIAYSSVSHMGLVMLGAATGTVEGWNGAVFQMFAHGIMTGLFFALVGAVYERGHTRRIAALGGLASRMPAAAAFFTLAALSSLGLPGTAGFIAELQVIIGAWRAGAPLWALAGIAGAFVTAVYVLGLTRRVFWGPPRPEHAAVVDLAGGEKLSIVMLGAAIILFGVWPRLVLDAIDATTVVVLRGLS